MVLEPFNFLKVRPNYRKLFWLVFYFSKYYSANVLPHNQLNNLYGLLLNSLFIFILITNKLDISGSHLTGTCRLVYKLSKNNKNDDKLIESDIPGKLCDNRLYQQIIYWESFSSAELFLEKCIAKINPIEECESIVYGYGALRFLVSTKTKDDRNSKKIIGVRLFSKGIVQVLTIHLQLFNDSVKLKHYA